MMAVPAFAAFTVYGFVAIARKALQLAFAEIHARNVRTALRSRLEASKLRRRVR